MVRPAHSSLGVLSRRLETLFTLTDAERAALEAIPVQHLSLKRNHDIVREGDRPLRCCAIIEGMACWFKVGSDGARQILAVHIPGDIPDLQSLHLGVLDSTLMAVSPCEVAFISHESIRDLAAEFPRIGAALWRWSLIDSAIFREWVMNVGGRQAVARVSHLLCEMFARLENIGLVEDNAFRLPMTQSELAEATGLSTVHVNRVLQTLRAKRLISLSANRLTVHDWDGLQEVGDFDATYLHLGRNGAHDTRA